MADTQPLLRIIQKAIQSKHSVTNAEVLQISSAQKDKKSLILIKGASVPYRPTKFSGQNPKIENNTNLIERYNAIFLNHFLDS